MQLRPLKEGQRVEHAARGTRGTVTQSHDYKVHVQWDDGRVEALRYTRGFAKLSFRDGVTGCAFDLIPLAKSRVK